MRPVPPLSPLDLLRARRVAEYPPDPIPNIIPGGGVSLIAGASGIGKTSFLAWWATRFRDNLPIFGHPIGPIAEQVMLSVDRSWVQSSSKWLEAVGYPEIRAYSPLDDPDFKPASARQRGRRIALLEKMLDQFTPALAPNTLVYVDPLAPFLGGNLNDYDACMVACMEIREVCRQRRLTIIGTAHTAKLKADPKDRYARVQDRILGSAALLGYTDTQMYLAAPEETGNGMYSFFWNPHHAPKATFNLAWDPKTGLFTPGEYSTRGEEQQAILTYLKTQPEQSAHFTELHLALSCSKSTLHDNLRSLIKDTLVALVRRGVYRYIAVN